MSAIEMQSVKKKPEQNNKTQKTTTECIRTTKLLLRVYKFF